MQTTRRVRHDVADAIRLAAFSLLASSAIAGALMACTRWMGVE